MTIAAGFVVDDAIVMIENITRYLEAGETPLRAAMKGAGEIGFTIVSLTVSLIAVLIPLLFMQEVVGRLFREFAVTLAITILISAVVSLTLVPMLCAKLLRRHDPKKQGAIARRSEEYFNRVIAEYDRLLKWVLDHQPLTLVVAVITLVFTILLYVVIPKGFFPTQDTSLVQGITQAGPTVSFAEMARRQQGLADELLRDPNVESLSSFIGVDGTNNTLNAGRFLINLVPKDQRSESVTSVIGDLLGRAQGVPGISLYLQPVQDLTIDSTVSRAQYQFVLEDASSATLTQWVPKLMTKLAAAPELQNVSTNYMDHGLSATVVVDRDTAARFGITAATIDNALYDALGQRIISTIFTQSNQYRVILEADPAIAELAHLAVGHISAVCRWRSGAAFGLRAGRGATGAAGDRSSGPVSRRDDLVRRRAGLFAGQRGQCRAPGGGRCGPAGQHHDAIPGFGARLPVGARQRTPADPRRHHHRLYRAGRPV